MQLGFISSVSFGRALSTQEEKEFTKTAKEAKEAINNKEGITLLKIYIPSMPAGKESDTGQGKLSSVYTKDFLKTMFVYTDADAVKIMPNGKFDKNGDKTQDGVKYTSIPYLRESLTIGEDNINIEELVYSKEWGNIVSEKEFKELTKNNSKSMKPNWINYENEFGFTKNYPILKPLKSAYNSIMNPKNEIQKNIKKEFEDFKKKPINEFYDRIAIVPLIERGKLQKDFFVDFNNSKDKQREFEKIKKENEKEIDFFKFNQFIALKQQNNVKKELNKEGKELWGDCPIGYGKYEILAFPDAFENNATIGWGLVSMKHDKILDKNSETHKLFKQKLKFFLENYDGIRFDVGWSYVNPKIKHLKDGKEDYIEHKEFDDKILNFINETAKEVKGKDFNTNKLVYEADASPEDFLYIDKETKKVKPFLKKHNLVLTSQYQNTSGWDGLGWNNPEFFKFVELDNYMLGHNHDVPNLRLFSEDTTDIKNDRENNVKVLSRLLNIKKEKLQNPEEFVKAKFAELFLAKNRYFMFYDVLGTKDILNANKNTNETFRTRLNENWEKEFHQNLQNNHGFNLMESLKSVMEVKGQDKERPEIYKKVVKFANILREKGALTRLEADKNEKVRKEMLTSKNSNQNLQFSKFSSQAAKPNVI